MYPQIRAELRTVHGSYKSRLLREQKIVPGVYYGKDDDRNVIKVPIQVDMLALNREIRKYGISFENTIYEMLLNDEKHLVTPRQLQVDPGKAFLKMEVCLDLTSVTDTPLNINFLRYSPMNRFRIPVEYINDELCVDIKRGCFVIHVNRFIECTCEGPIPRSFKIDLSQAKLGAPFTSNVYAFLISGQEMCFA